MIKTKTWVMLLASLLVICTGLSLLILYKPVSGSVANIYVDGKCVRSVDLSSVTESSMFVVETPEGKNTVLVEKGKIRIIEADCPDKVCVHTGWISDSAVPICCLPHKLVIRIEKKAKASDDVPDTISK